MDMFQHWCQNTDMVEIIPADLMYPTINTEYKGRGKANTEKVLTMLERHQSLSIMYVEEEFELSNLQVLHHAFHYDGKWYGILGTKYTPDVVPLDEKLIGSYKTPTEKVPDLEILLTGGSDLTRVTKRANIRNGVILIPSAMASLRGIALSDGAACLKAIRTFFREAIQSNSAPHLWTGDSGLPEEIAALEKYAETVLQWLYLAVKPNCRAVTAFKASTRADATSNAVSRGCQILRGYATPVAPMTSWHKTTTHSTTRKRQTKFRKIPCPTHYNAP
jgi:hypothetical protein